MLVPKENSEFKMLKERLRYLESNRNFLGHEFLTWVWFYIETRNGHLKVGQFGSFCIQIEEKMTLSSPSGAVREHILKGNAPAFAEEAQIALLGGKHLTECKFYLTQEDRTWSWIMRGHDLSLKSIRLPASKSKNEKSERLENLEILVAVVDALFELFKSSRISDKSKNQIVEMQNWALDRNQNRHNI